MLTRSNPTGELLGLDHPQVLQLDQVLLLCSQGREVLRDGLHCSKLRVKLLVDLLFKNRLLDYRRLGHNFLPTHTMN